MDVYKILEELRQERDQIDEVILCFERLAQSRGRRRGRPPSWMAGIDRKVSGSRQRKRKPIPPQDGADLATFPVPAPDPEA